MWVDTSMSVAMKSTYRYSLYGLLSSLIAGAILMAAPLHGGQFIYVANLNDRTISAFQIESNGSLTPLSGSPFEGLRYPSELAVDRSAKLLFVTDSIEYRITVYAIASDGALRLVGDRKFDGRRPDAVAVDPVVQVVYATVEHEGLISGLQIGPGHTLKRVPGAPFVTGHSPNSIAVDSTAGLLYVTNGDDNTISGYRVASNGALTSVARSRFATGSEPAGIAVDSAAVSRPSRARHSRRDRAPHPLRWTPLVISYTY
jgi:DNA-binding beta-propeller fold protein YncE